MKNNKHLFVSFVLILCMLTAVPLCSYAVQVKTHNGQIAPSVEAESEEMAAPVTADQITDGTYDITVRSDSSMFRVTACSLTVADGTMTADMTLGGTAYLRLYIKGFFHQ